MTDDLTRRLHEHARCVKSLAVALLGDHAAADDVAQETLLAAERHAPAAPASLRAWLLRVARRFASRWRRGEARRERRERMFAPGTAPSAADEAERAEQLQAIAAAITALTPPLRDVVLLRHYDGLPPRAIAAKLLLTVEAVESRLRRAHEQLRVSLQRLAPKGDARGALLAFVGVGTGPWNPLPGVAVSTKSKSLFAAAVVALLAGGATVFAWPRAPQAPATAPVAAHTAIAPAPAVAAETAARAEVAAPIDPDSPSLPRPSWTAHVTGRVVDAWRHPVADVDVVAELEDDQHAATRSDAAGRFALALPVANAWSCDGNVTAMRDALAGTSWFRRASNGIQRDDELLLVLTATGALSVEVCAGAVPIANAEVAAVRAAYQPGLRRRAPSDERGTARLPSLPPGRYVVGATAPDGRWVVGHGDVVAGRDAALRLDLASTVPVAVDVRARADHTPIAGAELDVLYHVDHASLPARIPLHPLVALPRTDADGRAVLTGLARGQQFGVGAKHPACRPMLTWNAPPIDWSAPAPQFEVLLDAASTLTWQLVDGELPVPPDGTVFRMLDTEAVLRAGRVHFDGPPLYGGPGGRIIAFGPGCYAVLATASDGPPAPARVCRSRHIEIELRTAAGEPLAGWPLMLAARDWTHEERTDEHGRVVRDDGTAEFVAVTGRGASGSQRYGEIDLRNGDGALHATILPPRRIRARVFVDDRRGLPGSFAVRCLEGLVGNLDEDVENGTLAFDVLTMTPAARLQFALDTMPGLSTGLATVAGDANPAEIEFRVAHTFGGTVEVALPPDGASDPELERYVVQGSGGYWGFAGQVDGRAPRRLSDLRPGRYRLRDALSETIGPEVEVLADGGDVRLTLDLSKVVPARGRVAAAAPFGDVEIEVRTRSGTVVQRANVFDDGTFAVRQSLDEPMVLVAVRGTRSSTPMPWTGAANDLLLVIPE